MTNEYIEERWSSAWPDALAFALGLGVARIAGWTTTDLVWSLWLSSLVVGYATIVWTIVRPGANLAYLAWRDREFTAQVLRSSRGAIVVAGTILVAGGLIGIAFFTIHFGGFHYVHSQFLNLFFPLDGNGGAVRGMVGLSTYVEVASRYWQFLPAAFLAERAAFARQPAPPKDDLSVVAAIAARKARNAKKSSAMFAPYANVMRMHALIFFFAFAHWAHADGFVVYAVVYGVYFFPWRLVSRRSARGARSPVST